MSQKGDQGCGRAGRWFTSWHVSVAQTSMYVRMNHLSLHVRCNKRGVRGSSNGGSGTVGSISGIGGGCRW